METDQGQATTATPLPTHPSTIIGPLLVDPRHSGIMPSTHPMLEQACPPIQANIAGP